MRRGDRHPQERQKTDNGARHKEQTHRVAADAPGGVDAYGGLLEGGHRRRSLPKAAYWRAETAAMRATTTQAMAAA